MVEACQQELMSNPSKTSALLRGARRLPRAPLIIFSLGPAPIPISRPVRPDTESRSSCARGAAGAGRRAGARPKWPLRGGPSLPWFQDRRLERIDEFRSSVILLVFRKATLCEIPVIVSRN
jgi:hypothetical protein